MGVVAWSGTHSSNLAENPKIRNIIWGFHGPGWLWVVGKGSRAYLPVFAALNPQNTCHGPRPGLTLAPQCSRGPPVCPATESTRKDPWAEEQKMPMCKKVHVVHRNMICNLDKKTCIPATESTRKDPRAEEQKMPMCKKVHVVHSNMICNLDKKTLKQWVL